MSRCFLTFELCNVHYALEVTHVRSVLDYEEPIKIPCSKKYVEGIINMHNESVTVVNLRKRFELEENKADKNTRIIVVEVCKEIAAEKNTVYGIVVDSVKEVVSLEDSQIDNAPKFGNNINAKYISGICNQGENFLVILNSEKIFLTDDENI